MRIFWENGFHISENNEKLKGFEIDYNYYTELLRKQSNKHEIKTDENGKPYAVKITDDIETIKSYVLIQLVNLKTEYSEKEFTYKEKYKQKNRELDKNNLTSIVTMLIATNQREFKDWKFKDLEDNDVYVVLTLEEMQELAVQMMTQTTRAMKCKSTLIERVQAMEDVEELKALDIRAEFELLFNGEE